MLTKTKTWEKNYKNQEQKSKQDNYDNNKNWNQKRKQNETRTKRSTSPPLSVTMSLLIAHNSMLLSTIEG